jgi:hypothetical protein
MEILESISWIGLGFVPTLGLLEIYDRLRRGRLKSMLRVVGKVPTLIRA